ncbi:hypothetical protein HKX48_005232 [Thoreauomyces humboldtii]|nr:hypothetical protein HKX48_005232 [Thoreauomyces humboldtii]
MAFAHFAVSTLAVHTSAYRAMSTYSNEWKVVVWGLNVEKPKSEGHWRNWKALKGIFENRTTGAGSIFLDSPGGRAIIIYSSEKDRIRDLKGLPRTNFKINDSSVSVSEGENLRVVNTIMVHGDLTIVERKDAFAAVPIARTAWTSVPVLPNEMIEKPVSAWVPAPPGLSEPVVPRYAPSTVLSHDGNTSNFATHIASVTSKSVDASLATAQAAEPHQNLETIKLLVDQQAIIAEQKLTIAALKRELADQAGKAEELRNAFAFKQKEVEDARGLTGQLSVYKELLGEAGTKCTTVESALRRSQQEHGNLTSALAARSLIEDFVMARRNRCAANGHSRSPELAKNYTADDGYRGTKASLFCSCLPCTENMDQTLILVKDEYSLVDSFNVVSLRETMAQAFDRFSKVAHPPHKQVNIKGFGSHIEFALYGAAKMQKWAIG